MLNLTSKSLPFFVMVFSSLSVHAAQTAEGVQTTTQPARVLEFPFNCKDAVSDRTVFQRILGSVPTARLVSHQSMWRNLEKVLDKEKDLANVTDRFTVAIIEAYIAAYKMMAIKNEDLVKDVEMPLTEVQVSQAEHPVTVQITLANNGAQDRYEIRARISGDEYYRNRTVSSLSKLVEEDSKTYTWVTEPLSDGNTTIMVMKLTPGGLPGFSNEPAEQFISRFMWFVYIAQQYRVHTQAWAN